MIFRFTSGAQWFERTTFNFNFSGDIMKHLKLTVAATVLMMALSFSAFAGEIDTGFTSPAPTQSTATIAGKIGTGAATTSNTSSTATTVNPLTQLILVLLNLLPRV